MAAAEAEKEEFLHFRKCSLLSGSSLLQAFPEMCYPWAPLPFFALLFAFSCGLQPIPRAFAAFARVLETADYIFLLILQKMKPVICSSFLLSLLLGGFQEEKWKMLICAVLIRKLPLSSKILINHLFNDQF